MRSLINYTISIESLLGEPPGSDVRLTESLSLKCGYWLGKNFQEKEQIKRHFKKIYRVRSEIVHSGETILKAKHKSMLYELERLTTHLIAESIKTSME